MAAIRVTQVVVEILTASGAENVGTPAASLFASLVWIMSGFSGVRNVVMARGTQVSASWIVSGGTSAFTYLFTFGQVTNYAGFVSTATTSIVTRTFSVAGGTLGLRQVSAKVSDAAGSNITSALTMHVGALVWPNLYDGKLQRENQPYRRTFPL